MRICLISSGNGGAFKAFYRLTGIPPSNILIVTDRQCGVETFAADQGISRARLSIADNEGFSDAAKREIDRFGGVDFVFLLFTRLVTRSLFAHYPTINFHPSLLPAFQGLHPIGRALQKQVKFVGTTMFLVVDDTVDDGKILAQATYPLAQDEGESRLKDVAFLHKVQFMLLVAENFESTRNTSLDFSGWPHTDAVNPSLRSERYQKMHESLVQAQSPRT
jgi:folate-dependent phosphoribosylglycinamide formyltransferase PurN